MGFGLAVCGIINQTGSALWQILLKTKNIGFSKSCVLHHMEEVAVSCIVNVRQAWKQLETFRRRNLVS